MRLAFAIALISFMSTAAFADGGEALERARRSYDELRYDEASRLLSQALEDGSLSSSQREQALLLKGVVEVVRGKDEEARIYFRELLAASPDVRLPEGLSPKITAVFDEVRASLPPATTAPDVGEGLSSPSQPNASPPVPSSSAADATSAAEEVDDAAGLSAVAVGVAAGAAVAAVVLVAGAGALLFASRGQPPESSLGTLQLP